MALTVTSINTIQLLNILNRNTAAQTSTLLQLATGKRINSGKDDPAGLIALSGLNAELRAVEASLSNNQRTGSVLTVADSAMGQISSLLGEIETLVLASASDANLTASEIAANQSQIDDALSAIDRIVTTTNFNGRKLIDGTFSILNSGVDGDFIDSLRIFSRSRATSDTKLDITRVASAQKASVVLTSQQATGVAERLYTSGTTEITITGALGTATVTLVDGLALSGVIDVINAAKDQTGVEASVSSVAAGALADTSATNLKSTSYGTEQYVSVTVLSGGAMNALNGVTDNGQGTADDMSNITKTTGVDADITVNGQATGADGLDISYSANGLSIEFTLDAAFGSGSQATTTTSFTVKASGGATFQLGTTGSTQATIGIDSMATYNLGGGNGTNRLSELKSGAAVDLNSDVTGALSTVREAIAEMASARGRLGGFQKFQVESAISSLQAAKNGLTSAASVIGDTDYAVATAKLTQQEVLIQSGITLLGIANQQAAQILSLL